MNPMRELITTRHNELVDPLLKVWGAEIAIYLFLGGMVAGMMIILGYFLFKGRHKELRCSCALLPALCIVLLSFGMLALFLDLGASVVFLADVSDVQAGFTNVLGRLDSNTRLPGASGCSLFAPA